MLKQIFSYLNFNLCELYVINGHMYSKSIHDI